MYFILSFIIAAAISAFVGRKIYFKQVEIFERKKKYMYYTNSEFSYGKTIWYIFLVAISAFWLWPIILTIAVFWYLLSKFDKKHDQQQT